MPNIMRKRPMVSYCRADERGYNRYRTLAGRGTDIKLGEGVKELGGLK